MTFNVCSSITEYIYEKAKQRYDHDNTSTPCHIDLSDKTLESG